MSGLRRAGGFTLIELIIVVAIIAILAAVATPQYTAFVKKAKAKELISISRSCLQELMGDCFREVPVGNLSSLDSCSVDNETILYLTEVSLSFNPPSSSDYCQESTVTVTARGKVDGREFTATCTYTRADGKLHCEGLR